MTEYSMELPPLYRALREDALALAEQIAPLAGEADSSTRTHPRVRELLAASGLTTTLVPAEYGGRFEKVDALAATVIREALSSVSAHLDTLFCMQGIGSYALSVAGDETVRVEWLPKVANLEVIAALALTEPQIGSDLRAITTRVTREGDRLELNGHKSFITNAGDAGFYCVLAREEDGYSMVFVPADAPGLSVTTPYQLIAPHVIGDVVFENVSVPEQNRIGAAGAGFPLVLETLATFRVSVAGAAVGLAQAALDEAVRHARSRVQFGSTLAELPTVRATIAQSWTDIEAARSLTYRAAAAATRDPRGSLHLSSMAKIVATETAGRVVDRGVQMMGRFGLVAGSTIERLYREARPMRIYEGSTEVILESLARKYLKGAS